MAVTLPIEVGGLRQRQGVPVVFLHQVGVRRGNVGPRATELGEPPGWVSYAPYEQVVVLDEPDLVPLVEERVRSVQRLRLGRCSGPLMFRLAGDFFDDVVNGLEIRFGGFDDRGDRGLTL